MSANDPYVSIKIARAWLAENPAKSACSGSTIEDYGKVAARLLAGAQSVAEVLCRAADTRKVRTWFKRRAALVDVARYQLTTLLSEQDKLQRLMRTEGTNEVLFDQWSSAIDGIEFYFSLMSSLPSGCPIPVENRQRKHSKKQDLPGLPQDWRERLAKRMVKYHLPFLAAAITGCRPAELQQSILFRIENDQLIAQIQGKKVTEHSGQPWRELIWDLPRSGLVGEMVREVMQAGGALSVRIDKPNTFSNAIRDSARREWPNRRKSVTCYCLRHSFTADVKSSEVSRQQLAVGMGHLSDETSQHYANAMQASGQSVAPDKMLGARPVRELYRHNPPKRKDIPEDEKPRT